MADKAKKVATQSQGPEVSEEQKELVIPKDATIDTPVTVISLDGDPYHENGAEFEVGKKTAEVLVKRGWVEIKKEKKKNEEA